MKKLIYAIAMVMLFANCDDEEEIKNNIEFTLTEFNIGITSATAEVILEDIEGYSIENSGVAYATSETPTTDDMTYAAQFEDDRISVNLSDLTADTTYYARAYVNVGDNVLYSSQISFKTKAIDEASPTLMTPVFEGVSATKVSVESNSVNNADYGTISEVGFVFMKDGEDGLMTNVETSDFSSFSAEFDVMQGESYSVKSYAVNEFGTFYSEVTAIVADWVEESTPLMTIEAPSDIADTTASFMAEITDDKNQDIISKGFVYGTSEQLEEGSITVESGNESFSFDVQNLEGGTMYYVKAYAENMYGKYYSEIVSFTTEYTEKIKEGDAFLKSQAEVDAFVAEKYTSISGSLMISAFDPNSGPPGVRFSVAANRMPGPPATDINDLSGLISIKTVELSVFIFGNPNLTSLEGLGNINFIMNDGPPMEEEPPMEEPPMEEPSGSFIIVYNPSLINLIGLESLTNATLIDIAYNDKLTSLDGLDNLVYIEEVYISDNELLSNYSALSSLVSASEDEESGFELDFTTDYNLYNPSFGDLINGKFDITDQENVVVETAILWQGPTMTFIKVDGTDSSLAENRDLITPNVSITRDDNGYVYSYFNVYPDPNAPPLMGPDPTLIIWAEGSISDGVSSLFFKNLYDLTPEFDDGTFLIGKNLVLYLTGDDIYIDVKFTSWSGDGSGFSYERSTATTVE